MATSTSVHLQRIARLLPKNKDLWRLGQELRRWRKETGLSDARLVSLLVEKFSEVDVPSPQRIQMLRATSSLFPKSQRLNLSHSHHVYAGQHARAMVDPGEKKTAVRDVATRYLRAARRNKWSVAQMRKAMATDAARGGRIHHISGPSGPSGGHYVKRTKRFTVIQGDAKTVLKTLKTPVHCVVTSPPYFGGLRTYGNSAREIGRATTGRPDLAELPLYIAAVCDALDAVPLDPLGSIWIVIGESRVSKGGACLGVPERLLLAMQDRGWLVADKVAWVKAAVMLDGTTVGGSFTPTSNLHRLNDGTLEWVFRFTKCEPSEAFIDPLAIRIPRKNGDGPPSHADMEVVTALDGRQPPNVWVVPVDGNGHQHYAAFPEALVERPLAMTCPAEVCTACGSARTRIIEWVPYDEGRGPRRLGNPHRRDDGKVYEPRKPVHKGWQECACRNPNYAPGVICDPYMGSGTSAAVALRLGRKFIGIDLYAKFCKMTVERLGKQRTRKAARTA